MIEHIVFDIDGVITDGSIIVDVNGNEQKKLNLKDIDAIFELHREGYSLSAITGETTEIVSYFEKRFPWKHFFKNCKNKVLALQEIANDEQIEMSHICYVGDGKYDVEPLVKSGLGICPSDAIDLAKASADIILQGAGGQGCLWELISLLKQYSDSRLPHNYFHNRIIEHECLFKTMASDQVLIAETMGLADRIQKTIMTGGQLYLCGNGGSAADAQHIAAEFVGRFYKERKGLPAEALSTNASILTAIGNDYGYESVFTRQVEAKAKKGDILIGFSTSGKSRNVINALHYAKSIGLATALFTGDYVDSTVTDDCDFVVRIPCNNTPRIQEAHIFIGHTIAEYVESKLMGTSYD